MTLLEYIQKINKDWDTMSDFERLATSLRFMDKYLVVMGFYAEVNGQRYLLN